MAKKSLIAGLAIIVLSLFCGVCFATEGLGATNLGNQITQSLNKAGDSVQNVVRTTTGTDDINHINNNVTNYTNTGVTTPKTTGYNTVGYNATRTATDTTLAGGMTTTTWMWIILAVTAVIIVSAVWYYAAQTNNRD